MSGDHKSVEFTESHIAHMHRSEEGAMIAEGRRLRESSKTTFGKRLTPVGQTNRLKQFVRLMRITASPSGKSR